jgi:hypothetical protein
MYVNASITKQHYHQFPETQIIGFRDKTVGKSFPQPSRQSQSCTIMTRINDIYQTIFRSNKKSGLKTLSSHRQKNNFLVCSLSIKIQYNYFLL